MPLKLTLSPKSVKIFEKHNVLSHKELEARLEIDWKATSRKCRLKPA
jgi:glutamine synthetase type III